MKEWLRDHDLSYRQVARQMGQSAASVSKKINGQVAWQQKDLVFFHDHYGLSSDFVLGLTSSEGREVVLSG